MDVLFHLLLCLMGLRLLCQLIYLCGTCQLISLLFVVVPNDGFLILCFLKCKVCCHCCDFVIVTLMLPHAACLQMHHDLLIC